jgi:hypothetical protein
MRLITEPAGERDLRERILGRQHQLLSARQPTARDIGERGDAEAARERAAEMPGAQTRNGGQVTHPKRCIEVGLDVGLDAGDLPRRQAPLQQRRRGMRGADIIAEKGRCASDAGPRSVAIATDRVIGVLEKFEHDRGEPGS